MNREDIVENAKEYVKNKMSGETTGHDWFHVERVWKNSLNIAEKEGGDLFVIQLAALLHDIGDRKITGLNENSSIQAREFLEKCGVDTLYVENIIYIIENMSFSDNVSVRNQLSLEGHIVQDADRLDALGAIGIARCFSYGGNRGIPLYDPEIMVVNHTKDSYKKSTTSINHFHEKLLLLKGLFNTNTGKKMAEDRHEFMEIFLSRFMKEWNSEDY